MEQVQCKYVIFLIAEILDSSTALQKKKHEERRRKPEHQCRTGTVLYFMIDLDMIPPRGCGRCATL